MRLQFKDIPTQLKLTPKDGTIFYDLEISQVVKIRELPEQKLHTKWELSIGYKYLEGQGLCYNLNFSDPLYNGSKEYTKLQWLYARIFSIFKKLDLIVNPNGGIHAILNKQEVIDNWKFAKKHIQKIYKDPDVDRLVIKTETLIYNKLDESLIMDPLFTFLFNDIYLNYGEKRAQVSEKVLTGHFGSVKYPILENRFLETSTNNDQLAIVDINTDLNIEKWPSKKIDHYLGELLGDLDTTDYLFARKGSYLLDFKASCILEGNLEVIGKIPTIYNKTTMYNLKQKQ